MASALSAIPNLQSSLTFWALRLQSEEVFDGDAGTDEPSPYPDIRKGIEFANYWTPTKWLTIDADFADSSAHFLTYRRESGRGGGSYVPEAARVIISSGIWVHDVRGWSTGLRWRYFGPRYLTQDGTANVLPPPACSITTSAIRFGKHWSIEGDIFNLLNAKADDITYNYQFQLTPASSPVTGNVFHPAEPRTFRIALTYKF